MRIENAEKEMNLYECVYSLSCLGDESVLLFNLFLDIDHVEQVPKEAASACNTSRLAENSHQALHSVEVRLTFLDPLRYAVHQITCPTHKEITLLLLSGVMDHSGSPQCRARMRTVD